MSCLRCCGPGIGRPPAWESVPLKAYSQELSTASACANSAEKVPEDKLRIRVGKYHLSSSFSVASCHYLKRSESVERIRENPATEKYNTKSSPSGSPSKQGREFCFCFPSDLITGCCFSVVCLELSQGFDLNLRTPTRIAQDFSVIREQGEGHLCRALRHVLGCAPGPRAPTWPRAPPPQLWLHGTAKVQRDFWIQKCFFPTCVSLER